MRVYFFSTCLGGVAYADTCMNAIRLLQKEGLEVVFKKDQTCCGQPSYNSGYYEQSKKIALYNVDLFKGEEPIIVPSGSCTGMMREDYLELFKGEPEYERVKQFCSRVYDLGEYLHKILKVSYQDKGEPTKVTWHSNCHALRSAKVIDSAKALISSLANVDLIELEREEECCGFGGTFSIKEPEISNAMVSQKIQDILSRDVEYLISADAGCLLNISGAMKKQNVAVKPIHLYDFLAQRIGIGA
ncbi:(Fe-S)-binding protein [Helicobacter sp. MIT 05-5293]|uniref:(Fe-S)-binding protein n=1 Tax=Helicobacter sp. MIT 05-5293 TaxID=1548149 RepID=UPI00051D5931|nr:(Fe-S)-binding protein [Helicobacter sp. MIT 05-5293]TLD80231.1 (Fe-S)-binding protein [Helicobacter sp. MIT 05-5293]